MVAVIRNDCTRRAHIHFEGIWLRLVTTLVVACVVTGGPSGQACSGQELFPETLVEADYASAMVDGIDRFVMQELQQSVSRRARHWKRDFASRESLEKSIATNRQRLAQIIGAGDKREPFDALELISTTGQSSLVAQTPQYEVHAVRWPVFRDVMGEGLLLRPVGREAIASAVVIPDADQTPEQVVGLTSGLAAENRFAARLAASGCLVVVPALIDRRDTYSVTYASRGTNQSHREFIYRPAFEMGHHVIGYEVQKVLSLIDWFASQSPSEPRPCGIAGYGEGGMIALLTAALDTRVDATLVSGYFQPREAVWSEPIDRNVFALLGEFGDAELAAMIAPRPLVIEACRGPEVAGPAPAKPGRTASAAPGRLTTPSPLAVKQEVDRARQLMSDSPFAWDIELIESGDGSGPPGSHDAVGNWWGKLSPHTALESPSASPQPSRQLDDHEARLKRQFDQLVADTQFLMRAGEHARKAFWSSADRSDLSKFQESTQAYRQRFYDDVIGRFDLPLSTPNPRLRKRFNEPNYVGYEVVLDVFPDVIANGILLLPKNIQPGERRPVVVCQHGLEGRPQDLADPKIDSPYYHQFAIRLAELGFITYSPQNPYLFGDRFRVLQRKLNPLGKTLFSVIVPQHQQTVNWLKSLPMVDGARIGFYGLSYGGKTAMRVPPLVDGYCLSICSGDFNEWIWKNASLSEPFTYPATHEYEIFEFNLGNTFNYAEMAALIAPRPFMVERGHHDGVGIDEWVNYEYAKVRLLYADLNIPHLTTIEHFNGPHEIHGVGTFSFLQQHLNWPPRSAPDTAAP